MVCNIPVFQVNVSSLRPLEVLHDSVSPLQPPKPTITACDTDNTATSVKKKLQ
jgi:hypothetical protein